jgi:hypothetical protein
MDIVGFVTPEITTGLNTHELEPLIAELRKISDGSPRLVAARQLADDLDAILAKGRPGPAIEPDDAQRFVLLRAARHVTDLGHGGELVRLRDRLYGTGDVRWIHYRLRFTDTRPVADFTSYALEYEVGDRLVTPTKEELRVVELRDGDPPELTVEPWRPTEPVD